MHQFLEYAATRGFHCKWCTCWRNLRTERFSKPSPQREVIQWFSQSKRCSLCANRTSCFTKLGFVKTRPRLSLRQRCCRFYSRFFLGFRMGFCFPYRWIAWRENHGTSSEKHDFLCEIWEYKGVLQFYPLKGLRFTMARCARKATRELGGRVSRVPASDIGRNMSHNVRNHGRLNMKQMGVQPSGNKWEWAKRMFIYSST